MLVVGCSPVGIGRHATPLTKLTVGLGYIPSVQFAQFYRAQQQGYYRAAGLDVTFQNGRRRQPRHARRTGRRRHRHRRRHERHPGRRPGHPDSYAATIYAQFPNVVHRPGATAPIKTAADLEGHSLGIPGRLRLELDHAPGTALVGRPDDGRHHRSATTPTTARASALQQGQVELGDRLPQQRAVQLGLQGFATTQFTVDSIMPLPGPGLIVGTATLSCQARRATGVRRRNAARDGRDQGEPAAWTRRHDRRRARAGQRTRPPSWRSSRRRSSCGPVRTLRRTARARSTASLAEVARLHARAAGFEHPEHVDHRPAGDRGAAAVTDEQVQTPATDTRSDADHDVAGVTHHDNVTPMDAHATPGDDDHGHAEIHARPDRLGHVGHLPSWRLRRAGRAGLLPVRPRRPAGLELEQADGLASLVDVDVLAGRVRRQARASSASRRSRRSRSRRPRTGARRGSGRGIPSDDPSARGRG